MTHAPPAERERLPGGDLLLLVVITAAAALVAVDEAREPAAKAVAIGLLAACGLLAKLASRPGVLGDGRGWAAAGYAAALVSLFTTAAVISPKSEFALFALGPYSFTALPFWRAVTVVVVLNFAPALRFVSTGLEPAALLEFTAGASLVTTLSILIGSWICGVIRESTGRAELIRELETTRAKVAELSAERGAMAERERLARDIHDTLAQGFTSIIMLLEAAQSTGSAGRHVSRAIQTARENLAEARALVAELTPASLTNSLEDALRRLAAARQEDLGIPVAFAASGPSRQLPADLEVALLRAAQEALSNVGKHAQARSAELSLRYEEAEVRLQARDDGRGFDPAADHDGYGLRGMRSRAAQAGGRLEVSSGDGQGTGVTITVPTAPFPAASEAPAAADPVPAGPGSSRS